MLDTGPLAAVGWLLFVMGVGIAIVATLSKGARMKSMARRTADALTGAVLCCIALALIVTGDRTLTYAFLAAAVLATAASWYIGRHTRQIDRATKRARRHG
jgi:hypothetical protein